MFGADARRFARVGCDEPRAAQRRAVSAESRGTRDSTRSSRAPSLPKTTTTASADPNFKYCIESEPFTGSKVVKTECKTRVQWAKEGVNVDELKAR